ncbi:hypothetical protein BV898_06726 [Hypsibius exemplaris]|uniref:G-protein coupled receptors family 1 profile domain-containing protein n=1 Tax=Hypsibius exemplaris TaxID=2072580 RepID=A0A1W0WVR2_HYPEX|nr:hypothetical protein BV898_06726 [Hypsibius exemplaris]
MVTTLNSSTVRRNFTPTDDGNATTRVIPVWETFHDPLRTWFIINLTICGAGALANLLLLTAILSSGAHRRGCGTLIVNIVFIELCMCAVHLPLNTVTTFQAQFHAYPEWVCPYIHFTFQWTQQAGHWSACFLALNRFVAIVCPIVYPRWTTRVAYAGMISVGVGGRFAFVAPWYSCGPRSDGTAILPVLISFGVYLPEVLTAALYLAIFVKVKIFGRIFVRRNNIVDGLQPKPASIVLLAKAKAQRRFALAKIMLASSVWYCLCYFPNNIITSTSLLRYFIANPVLQLWIRTVFLCGFAVNPVFFFAMSRHYRIAAARLFGLAGIILRRTRDRSLARF